MASITVRNLSEELIGRLKAQAKRNGRAMEAEVRSILEREVMDRRLLLDVIEAELELQSEPTSPKQVDAWIRRSRERAG